MDRRSWCQAAWVVVPHPRLICPRGLGSPCIVWLGPCVSHSLTSEHRSLWLWPLSCPPPISLLSGGLLDIYPAINHCSSVLGRGAHPRPVTGMGQLIPSKETQAQKTFQKWPSQGRCPDASRRSLSSSGLSSHDTIIIMEL